VIIIAMGSASFSCHCVYLESWGASEMEEAKCYTYMHVLSRLPSKLQSVYNKWVRCIQCQCVTKSRGYVCIVKSWSGD